jgi:hypothetical protein
MQFKAFEEGIEVNGQTVYAIIDGFKHFRSLAAKFLLNNGIGESDQEQGVIIDPEAWYSQEAWLDAFEAIAKAVGDSVLFQIGVSIPRNAQFPPWVVDIESAVKSVDIAYHMNHRKQGQIMFNPENMSMTEGIGHYGFEKIEGKNIIVSKCENPYPCDFDCGIMTTMASKFEVQAAVAHNDSEPCRKNGADSCTYMITW